MPRQSDPVGAVGAWWSEFETSSSSTGRFVASAYSRDAKSRPSLEAGSSAKLTGPSPVTSGFTLYSTAELSAMFSRSSITVAPALGRLDQLTVDSVQLLPAERSVGPSIVPVIEDSFSLAETTVPSVTPATANRR